MYDIDNIFAVIAVLFLFMMINIMEWERLSKRTQLSLEKLGRNLGRLHRENPVVYLEFAPNSGEDQRNNAILDWLGQPKS